MPLSDDKRFTPEDAHLIIQRFEKMLRELLESHAGYHKQIVQLTKENEVLKGLLQTSKRDPIPNMDKSIKNLFQANENERLMQQINAYIKEIDCCLVYFEQI